MRCTAKGSTYYGLAGLAATCFTGSCPVPNSLCCQGQRSANAVFLLWVRTDFGKPQTGGLGGDPPAGGPGAGAPGKILRIGAQIVAFRKGIQGHQCLHVILCTGESHSPSRLQSCTATLSLSQPATARQG